MDLAALLWLFLVPPLYDGLGALSGPARPAAVTGEVAAVLLAAVIAWRQEGRRIEAEREATENVARKGKKMSAQGQQPQAGQPGQAQQAAQQQAQQHDPQALQAAAQFGQALQQHGVQAATVAGLMGWAVRNLPTILGMIQDLAGQVGGGGQPAAQAGQPPGAQAAGS